MDSHDKLVRYIRRGLRKGFAIEYLEETLIKHGHDEQAVRRAASHATGGPEREQSRQRLKILLGVIAIVAVVLLGALLLGYQSQQQKIEVLEHQVDLTQEAAQSYLSELDRLDSEIHDQQDVVGTKIQELRQESDDTRLQSLLDEVERLHTEIREERKQTRDLLFELLTAIVDRQPQLPEPELTISSTTKEAPFDDKRAASYAAKTR